jgi:opacity protein-like surface antigen/outer membrane protein OmpA-like peptidoglycan-associated protein
MSSRSANSVVRTMMYLVALLAIGSSEVRAQKVEFGPYGGGSFFSDAFFRGSAPSPNTPFGYSFVNGGVLGVRVRENLAEHFGLEQSFTFLGNNNVQFPGALVGTRLRQLYFNGNLIGYDNESRVRPYFSGGVGVSMFNPEDVPVVSLVQLDNSNEFAYNFGGGLKFKLTDHFGLDFSLRDFLHKTPTFDNSYSERDWIHNLQVQGGLLFMFGDTGPPVVHRFDVGPAIEAGKTALCPGETTTLRLSASDSIPEAKLTYNWTVKGQQVSTNPEYTFTAPGEPGTYDVAAKVFYDTTGLDKRSLKAVKKAPFAPVERTTQITVKEDLPTQASAAVDRATVQRGERVRLTGSGVCSECQGAPSYRWTVDGGQLISGSTQATAELDTSNVAFSDTIQGRQQKTVRATLEVTCEKGTRATATQEIAVAYTAPLPPPPPKAIQLSDINYGQNSSRVNNCAKRVLANELYAQMTDSRYRDYDILLIGHYDASERPAVRGKRDTSLDRERVLNAVAFLSGGGDTCKDIELSRVKVAWVGSQQTDDYKSTFCDASTQEKRSDVVSSTDEKAKNRRVEIWLVPRGADLPAGSGSVQDVPGDEVRAKACPK